MRWAVVSCAVTAGCIVVSPSASAADLDMCSYPTLQEELEAMQEERDEEFDEDELPHSYQYHAYYDRTVVSPGESVKLPLQIDGDDISADDVSIEIDYDAPRGWVMEADFTEGKIDVSVADYVSQGDYFFPVKLEFRDESTREVPLHITVRDEDAEDDSTVLEVVSRDLSTYPYNFYEQRRHYVETGTSSTFEFPYTEFFPAGTQFVVDEDYDGAPGWEVSMDEETGDLSVDVNEDVNEDGDGESFIFVSMEIEYADETSVPAFFTVATYGGDDEGVSDCGVVPDEVEELEEDVPLRETEHGMDRGEGLADDSVYEEHVDAGEAEQRRGSSGVTRSEREAEFAEQEQRDEDLQALVTAVIVGSVVLGAGFFLYRRYGVPEKVKELWQWVEDLWQRVRGR